jgi:hypothetical protein
MMQVSTKVLVCGLSILPGAHHGLKGKTKMTLDQDLYQNDF